MVHIASGIVAIFGFLIFVACCWGIVAPTHVLRTVEGMMASGVGMPVAIGVRLVAALITAAPASWTPRAFFLIGCLSLAAALALPFIGGKNVMRLVQWLGNWPVFIVRSWLVFGAGFGAYLIYAVEFPTA